MRFHSISVKCDLTMKKILCQSIKAVVPLTIIDPSSKVITFQVKKISDKSASSILSNKERCVHSGFKISHYSLSGAEFMTSPKWHCWRPGHLLEYALALAWSKMVHAMVYLRVFLKTPLLLWRCLKPPN